MNVLRRRGIIPNNNDHILATKNPIFKNDVYDYFSIDSINHRILTKFLKFKPLYKHLKDVEVMMKDMNINVEDLNELRKK